MVGRPDGGEEMDGQPPMMPEEERVELPFADLNVVF